MELAGLEPATSWVRSRAHHRQPAPGAAFSAFQSAKTPPIVRACPGLSGMAGAPSPTTATLGRRPQRRRTECRRIGEHAVVLCRACNRERYRLAPIGVAAEGAKCDSPVARREWGFLSGPATRVVRAARPSGAHDGHDPTRQASRSPRTTHRTSDRPVEHVLQRARPSRRARPGRPARADLRLAGHGYGQDLHLGVGVEERLHAGLQISAHDALGDPVRDGRHPEHSRAAVSLRYLHRAHRRGM